jgi:hypothetical protein
MGRGHGLAERGCRGDAEVDAILREFWPDHCQLRRALVERVLLNRKDGVYWRVG